MPTKSAVLAGAVIGSFSWFSITSAFWLASACWYASLVLSILAILLAAQQISVFHFLGDVSELDPKSGRSTFERYRSLLIENVPNNRNQSLDPEVSRFRSKSTMVFIWQCPMMFMSYSVCLFLLGLTLVVITPLIRLRRQGWNGDVNVRIRLICRSLISADLSRLQYSISQRPVSQEQLSCSARSGYTTLSTLRATV